MQELTISMDNGSLRGPVPSAYSVIERELYTSQSDSDPRTEFRSLAMAVYHAKKLYAAGGKQIRITGPDKGELWNSSMGLRWAWPTIPLHVTKLEYGALEDSGDSNRPWRPVVFATLSDGQRIHVTRGFIRPAWGTESAAINDALGTAQSILWYPENVESLRKEGA